MNQRSFRHRGRRDVPPVHPARYVDSWLHRRPRRVIIRIVIGATVLAVFAWPLGWEAGLVLGCLAASGHFLYSWRRYRLATGWQKEAYAERKTAALLYRLESEGYYVFHDRYLGRVRLNHLAVGPTGIWLVHGVGRAFLLRILGETAYLHPEDQPAPPRESDLKNSAAKLSHALGAGGRRRIRVQPIFAVFASDIPEDLKEAGDVPAVAGNALLDYIRMSASVLSTVQIDRLSAAVETATAAQPNVAGQDDGGPDRGGGSIADPPGTCS